MSVSSSVATMTVLTTLGESAIKKISFDVREHRIVPDCYAQVRRAIVEDRIDVVVNSRLGGGAIYDSGKNQLELADGHSTHMERKALIVHECTHAWCDLKLVKNMTVRTSEAAAYLAQCVYARVKTGQPEREFPRLQSTNTLTDLVFELAWRLAGKIINNHHNPTLDEIRALEEAISNSPHYRSNADTLCKWDGVPLS